MIKVYQPGTQIQFINAGREDTIDESLPLGTITQVAIFSDFSVQYNVVWWDKNNRKSEWVLENEFVVRLDPEKVKIGFKT